MSATANWPILIVVIIQVTSWRMKMDWSVSWSMTKFSGLLRNLLLCFTRMWYDSFVSCIHCPFLACNHTRLLVWFPILSSDSECVSRGGSTMIVRRKEASCDEAYMHCRFSTFLVPGSRDLCILVAHWWVLVLPLARGTPRLPFHSRCPMESIVSLGTRWNWKHRRSGCNARRRQAQGAAAECDVWGSHASHCATERAAQESAALPAGRRTTVPCSSIGDVVTGRGGTESQNSWASISSDVVNNSNSSRSIVIKPTQYLRTEASTNHSWSRHTTFRPVRHTHVRRNARKQQFQGMNDSYVYRHNVFF